MLFSDCDGLGADRLIESLSASIDRSLGDSPGNLNSLDQLVRQFESAVIYTKQLAGQMETGAFDCGRESENQGDTKSAIYLPPILERAAGRKADAVEAEALKYTVQKKDGELMELKRMLRLAHEEMSEVRVRYEMAEIRASKHGEAGDERTASLNRRITQLEADLAKKEAEYRTSTEALQVENAELDEEVRQLKEKQKMTSRYQLSSQLKGTIQESGGAKSTLNQGEAQLLMSQLDVLQSALTASEAERWALKGEKMREVLRGLRPLASVPQKMQTGCIRQHEGGFVDLEASARQRHDETARLARNVDKLTNVG